MCLIKKGEVTRRYRQTVKCPRCKHIFKTRTRSLRVSCGYCGTQFKRVENIVKNGNEITIIKRRRYRQTVECPRCEHIFKTRTRSLWITCHECNLRFKRIANLLRGQKQQAIDEDDIL